MRLAFAALLCLASTAPAFASGMMHQSPALAHAAGTFCKPGHPRGPAGSGPRIAGCPRRAR